MKSPRMRIAQRLLFRLEHLGKQNYGRDGGDKEENEVIDNEVSRRDWVYRSLKRIIGRSKLQIEIIDPKVCDRAADCSNDQRRGVCVGKNGWKPRHERRKQNCNLVGSYDALGVCVPLRCDGHAADKE